MSSRPPNLTPALRKRVVIANVLPEIDAGRYPAKRCTGEPVVVQATIHADGADSLAAVLQYRQASLPDWQEIPLGLINPGKDLWQGEFVVSALGFYDYTVEAWVDVFATWQKKLQKKFDAGQNIELDVREGIGLIEETITRSTGEDDGLLRAAVATLSQGAPGKRMKAALAATLTAAMRRGVDRQEATRYRHLSIRVDRERARTGAWYEMFPRSAGAGRPEGATFAEAENLLSPIAKMGFDVLYLPPIHPIGKSFRKGPDNNPKSGPLDPGSPWAIGSSEGGHKSIHPALGTLADFDHFVQAASKENLEVALDLAYQCSPDHPYVREHPEWFHHRPDGSIQYAENPPKKYEDIYPIDFECAQWEALWEELKSIVLFWAAHGIKIFRVDNPHTKPFQFWEWMIGHVQAQYPETLFLAEAFTRPAVMQHLAKVGFSQSYTYFTWRTTSVDLTEYLTDLTQTDVCEYMRPNFFANTPDILHTYLQTGGRAAFQIRLILAATLGASYGIYGPAYELCESDAFPTTEDYKNSEKYQIRKWDWDRPGNIKPLITQVNQIRRANSALSLQTNLRFYSVDNPQLLFYGKRAADDSHSILVIINLDPKNIQSGWVTMPRAELALPEAYEVHDLLSDETYSWHGDRNFVKLDPAERPAHILRINHAKT